MQGYSQFSVSDNKPYLVRDGKPFLWIGDTGWELFHRLSRQQADHYLKRRSGQGFYRNTSRAAGCTGCWSSFTLEAV